jgi:hypothetical protein
MTALPATFFAWISVSLSRRNNDRMRSRRARKGEGADARQTAVRQTSHRGASQHEGEGKDEAQGSHLTVSGVNAGAGRRFRCQIDNHPVFPEVCAKSGKWFRPAGELFRHKKSDETIVRKVK